jgi:hypothetical protein
MMEVEKVMRHARIVRFLHSLPASELLSTGALAAAFLGIVATLGANHIGNHPFFFWIMALALCISMLFLMLLLILIVAKIWVEYHHRTYDTSLISDKEREFDAMIYTVRMNTARRCLEFYFRKSWEGIHRRDDVDDILDFFDVLGSMVGNNLISDEVAHEYFYTHLRIYYYALKHYFPIGTSTYGNTAIP